MEAFLQEPITRDSVADIIRVVTEIPGVSQVIYISKDEAAQIFKQQFGEDIHSVLDFNPLPPSLKIFLEEGYRTAVRADEVHKKVTATKGIESVIYRKALLEFIDQKAATLHNITLGLGILISLSAIFLVSNTIRLAIYAKRRLLRTMELVGATPAFIRLPFLLEGILQGAIGGILASAILYMLLEYGLRFVLTDVAQFVRMDSSFYLFVLAAGAGLGLVGSIISIARFIKTVPRT
jgi:cell division transport system permease protein